MSHVDHTERSLSHSPKVHTELLVSFTRFTVNHSHKLSRLWNPEPSLFPFFEGLKIKSKRAKENKSHPMGFRKIFEICSRGIEIYG